MVGVCGRVVGGGRGFKVVGKWVEGLVIGLSVTFVSLRGRERKEFEFVSEPTSLSKFKRD